MSNPKQTTRNSNNNIGNGNNHNHKRPLIPNRLSILETIRNRDARRIVQQTTTTTTSSDNDNPPAHDPFDQASKAHGGRRRPVVARISLWTPRISGGKLNRINSGDSDSNSDYDSDQDHDGLLADSDADDDSGAEHDLELDDNSQLEQRLKRANLPDHVRRVAAKEMQKLRRTPSFMSDYAITRSYLELIAELPWNEATVETIDLRKSRRDLDNDHYGMQRPKERVLQYLAVRKLKQSLVAPRPPAPLTTSSSSSSGGGGITRSSQPILMFVGPPGTGKTSIAQSIASSLGRKFQRISLGGIADQSAIRGHRRTYIGAMPGRIIQGIKQVGVNNPVFLLDEVDKMDAGPQGDPSAALLEVLDPEQNHTFTDHYLNVAFDLSNVLFIATANSTESLPAALLDRMEVIQVAGYTHDEKFHIARRHLIPKQVLDNGLRPNQIAIRDDAIHKIIGSYAREAGVRALERKLAAICRVVAVRIVESQQQQQQQQQHVTTTSAEGANGPPTPPPLKLPVVVDADSLESFLGPVVYDRESSARASVPGVAIGLAWTATGGEITFVEAEIMKGGSGALRGRDSLVLTGQLGSVMRESAMLALNWIRANYQLYEGLPASLDRELVDNTVHVHFPAGAVGKDGPSAGVTIVVALVSLCAGLPVAADLAMTGEITLRGVVLKVGGVKSKVLAAHRAGIKRVLLPARNEADLHEVPAAIKDKMRFHFVTTIDECLRIAFDNKLAVKQAASSGHLASADTSRSLTSKL